MGTRSAYEEALRLGAERLSALRADNATRDDARRRRSSKRFSETPCDTDVSTPLPHAPTTPGGREHADEVSITPHVGRGSGRDGSVSVLASPASPRATPRRESKKKSGVYVGHGARGAREDGEKGTSEDDIAPKRLEGSRGSGWRC